MDEPGYPGPACGLQERVGAGHVGGEESSGVQERAVDVRLGREVDHGVVPGDESAGQVGVEDVAVHELAAARADGEFQVGEVARVGEGVEHGHVLHVIPSQQAVHEVRADEPGSAGDQNFHRVPSPLVQRSWRGGAAARQAGPSAFAALPGRAPDVPTTLGIRHCGKHSPAVRVAAPFDEGGRFRAVAPRHTLCRAGGQRWTPRAS